MKMTISNCLALQRLDRTLYNRQPATVTTQFGDVIVHKSLDAGYVAELEGQVGEGMKAVATGPTPAIAFLSLSHVLKDKGIELGRPNILPFPIAKKEKETTNREAVISFVAEPQNR